MRIAYLFEILLLLYFVSFKVSNKSKYEVLGTIAVLLFYFAMKMNYESLDIINILTMIGSVAIVERIIQKQKWITCIWMGCLFAVCIDLGRLLTYGSVMILSEYDFYLSHQVILRIIACICKMILIILTKKYLIENNENEITLGTLLLTIIPISLLLYNRIIMVQGELLSDKSRQIVTFFLIAGLTLLTLFVLMLLLSFDTERKKKDKLEELIKQSYDELAQKEEVEKAVMRAYHDMKHQLLGLSALSNSEEVQGEIAKILDGIHSYESIPYTKNRMLDTLLNEKMHVAETKHIQLEISIQPHIFDFMEPSDLCSVFGNAIDNAIEACEKCEDIDKRLIEVKACCIGGIVVLTFINPYKELHKEGNQYVTTKEDQIKHGFGLTSISYSIKKYNGRVRIDDEDGYFELKIMIPMPVIPEN